MQVSQDRGERCEGAGFAALASTNRGTRSAGGHQCLTPSSHSLPAMTKVERGVLRIGIPLLVGRQSCPCSPVCSR